MSMCSEHLVILCRFDSDSSHWCVCHLLSGMVKTTPILFMKTAYQIYLDSKVIAQITYFNAVNALMSIVESIQRKSKMLLPGTAALVIHKPLPTSILDGGRNLELIRIRTFMVLCRC